ncbi:MAG: phenylalanine--tRNA ligase subunit alpha [Oscillospiraceae bacterium]|nr:phenylalanine--tRNA ligase subunit alpha [Oscillospiraceae bacterium]
MKEAMQRLREASIQAILESDSPDSLENLRVKYLGKKGELTAILRQMGKLSAEERPAMGQLANQLRGDIEASIEKRRAELNEAMLARKLERETLDVTMPGEKPQLGHKHPMYNVLDQIKEIFIGMGFEIVDGPEVELADYNFTKLNIDEGHPSREWTDTFYFTEDSRILLRTQTSPMQIHAMEAKELPIRMIAPGRVYRKDEVDATHSPMFHQIEGMVIDKGVTMSDLKATLNLVVEKIYGKGTVTRFRPHHFPFTEPSCEMDIQCHKCGGKGCPTCKGEGWIEVLGAGMVHPKVLAGCGIDPDVYSGWAFGMGLERLAMGEYKITDLRLIFENDVRFLEQF